MNVRRWRLCVQRQDIIRNENVGTKIYVVTELLAVGGRIQVTVVSPLVT